VILWSRNRTWSRVWFIIMITGPLLAIYILRPSITPDHPWAMRRFYTTALILIPLLQGIAFEWTARWSARSTGQSRALRRSVFGLVAAAAVLATVSVSVPLLTLGSRAGLRASVNEMCQTLPENAAVVVHEDSVAADLGAAIRSFCDVPTVASAPGLEIPEIGTLALEIADRGRVPVLITETDRVPVGWMIIGTETTEFSRAEVVVLRPPAGVQSQVFSWFASIPVGMSGESRG